MQNEKNPEPITVIVSLLIIIEMQIKRILNIKNKSLYKIAEQTKAEEKWWKITFELTHLSLEI